MPVRFVISGWTVACVMQPAMQASTALPPAFMMSSIVWVTIGLCELATARFPPHDFLGTLSRQRRVDWRRLRRFGREQVGQSESDRPGCQSRSRLPQEIPSIRHMVLADGGTGKVS